MKITLHIFIAGHSKVLRIPIGARTIKITSHKAAKSYLGLLILFINHHFKGQLKCLSQTTVKITEFLTNTNIVEWRNTHG